MTTHAYPWFDEYDQFGIPESLEYPDEPLHHLIETAAEEYPTQGLFQRGAHVPYPDVLDHVERLATALRERGVEKGDRVATVLPTSVQFVVANYAISRAGGVHIPNDFLDAEDDLRYRLQQGDPDVLIGHDEHRDLLFGLRDDLGLDDVVLTSIDDYSDDPPVHDGDSNGESTDDAGDAAGVTWFRDLVERTPRDPPSVDFDPAEDVHTLLFTGGTTGRPKGCLLTHRNLYANALQGVASQSRMAELMRGGESAIMALPMYHAYGYSVTNSLVELGMDVLLVPDARDTDEMRRLVEQRGALIMMGVPTQFMELVNEELEQDVIGISGSAPLADTTRKDFERTSKGISQGYGLSEMSPITHFNTRGLLDMLMGEPSADDAYDQPTVGVPVPDTNVKLRDVDTGESIPLSEAAESGREGEMLVDGPQRMKGYLDAERDPFTEDGYVATGDVVKIDPSGRFYVVDRVKNMVNVSGLKVYTEEVDEVLFEHEGIKRPATVGVPDPERPGSERVKVYVEPTDAFRGRLTPEDVREHLDGEVPQHAMPSSVEVVDEVPTTDIGKTDKKRLKDRHETPAETEAE